MSKRITIEFFVSDEDDGLLSHIAETVCEMVADLSPVGIHVDDWSFKIETIEAKEDDEIED